MNFFFISQVLFDAILLFGILFLFHYSVHHSQKKKEESDDLKNIQLQEMKENLHELLLTLKQLGKEVSDNIQEQVREAEDKTEIFKRAIQKLQKDLSKTLSLAQALDLEKSHLEDKLRVVQTAKKSLKNSPSRDKDPILNQPSSNLDLSKALEKASKAPSKPKALIGNSTVDFSSELVKEVYRLADSNNGLNEIVHKTQLSRAEIQLILNLRENRFTTPN